MKRTIHNLQTGEITVVDMTSDEVAAKQAKQVEYDKVKYKKDRVFSYPSIGEQLDLLYWDKKNGTNKWVEAVDKVKSDNPKP
jgi:phage baseplate assembly protein gpV